MMQHRSDLPLLVLLASISLLLFLVFVPFLTVLALAAMCAVLLHRPYEALVKAFGGWRSVSAFLTVGGMLIFCILPLLFLGMQVFQEAQGLYVSVYMNGATSLHAIQATVERPLQQAFPHFSFDLASYVENILITISANLGTLVYHSFSVVLDTFLMLLALFFFLRDGHGILASSAAVSPLGREVTNGILETIGRTIRSVIRGTLFTAFIRWLCIWAAFSFLGIPNAVLWGSIGGIVGAIPGIGTLLVFVGAASYTYVLGDLFAATTLVIVGIAIMALVDNLLTTFFLGKGLHISPVFVLFSILGGIAFFGPLGFVLGPLVLSVFLSLVRVHTLVGTGL